jgi:hypothetical protein
MSAPPAILNKIKLLRNLINSPNENESTTARSMMEGLIEKYKVSEAELNYLEEKVYYGEDEKLYTTIGIVGWRRQLALAVATYFDAQIVQEVLAPGDGLPQCNYFVYADEDQVKDTKFVYYAFAKKVDYLINTQCLARGPIYIDSYCEGVVESIKWNIQMYGIDIPDIKKPLRKSTEETVPTNSTSITTTKSDKEEPTNNRVDVNSQSFIKDVLAYFKGIDDGKHLSLQSILELEVENEEAKRLAEQETEPHVQ